MSKFNIGVGDDFPLDESPVREHRHGRHRRHHRHHHHFHPHHHRHHWFFPLPLLIAVVAIAAAIGAGKFSHFADHPVLIAVGVVALLMFLARAWMHWRWHRKGA